MALSNLKNRIAAGVGGVVIALTSCVTTTYLTAVGMTRNQKPYNCVLKDVESFDVDMEVAGLLNRRFSLDKYVRLKMEEDKPVIVECEDDLEEREIKIVEKVVEYYNKIFATINDKYSFIVKDDNVKIGVNDTVISVSNKTPYKESYSGEYRVKTIGVLPNIEQGIFIKNANIYINWDKLKDNESDLYAYATVLHEFGHALGLGDVYYEGDEKWLNNVDMSTMMQTKNDFRYALYPNDYKILQALYSNEYKKHSDYEEAVKVVNEKIEKYSKSFYKYYAAYLKEYEGATDELSRKGPINEIDWEFGPNKYSLRFKDNYKCDFVMKDYSGNVKESCEGKVVFIDGVMFVKDIVVKEAKSCAFELSEYDNLKLILRIYIDEYGGLVIDDGVTLPRIGIINKRNSR